MATAEVLQTLGVVATLLAVLVALRNARSGLRAAEKASRIAVRREAAFDAAEWLADAVRTLGTWSALEGQDEVGLVSRRSTHAEHEALSIRADGIQSRMALVFGPSSPAVEQFEIAGHQLHAYAHAVMSGEVELLRQRARVRRGFREAVGATYNAMASACELDAGDWVG